MRDTKIGVDCDFEATERQAPVPHLTVSRGESRPKFEPALTERKRDRVSQDPRFRVSFFDEYSLRSRADDVTTGTFRMDSFLS